MRWEVSKKADFDHFEIPAQKYDLTPQRSGTWLSTTMAWHTFRHPKSYCHKPTYDCPRRHWAGWLVDIGEIGNCPQKWVFGHLCTYF